MMIFTALAMLLAHDFIPHHHHDKEHVVFDHHHSHADDHHHHNESDDNENDFDFLHFLSHIPHSGDGVIFLKVNELDQTQHKQLNASGILQTHFTFDTILGIKKQNSPPLKIVYYNSKHYLPSGLRAPPSFIV